MIDATCAILRTLAPEAAIGGQTTAHLAHSRVKCGVLKENSPIDKIGQTAQKESKVSHAAMLPFPSFCCWFKPNKPLFWTLLMQLVNSSSLCWETGQKPQKKTDLFEDPLERLVEVVSDPLGEAVARRGVLPPEPRRDQRLHVRVLVTAANNVLPLVQCERGNHRTVCAAFAHAPHELPTPGAFVQ